MHPNRISGEQLVVNSNDIIGSKIVGFANETPLLFTATDQRVHNLDTGLDYTTIQDAIDANATLNGHRIFAESGVYHENLVVGKSLLILGENASSTILDSNSSGSFNVIANADLTLSQFTIQNGYSGIFGSHTSAVTVTNCIIRNQYYFGVFIQTYDKVNVTVRDSLIADSGGGIQISYSEGFCAIERNNLSQVDSGILIGWGNPVSGGIINNTIVGKNHGTGADLTHFNNGLVEGNYIAAFYDGMYLTDFSYNEVVRNTLTANDGISIALMSSNSNIVVGNDILNNGFGIWLSSSSADNVVYQNNFVSNLQQAHFEPPSFPNIWDNGYPSGGNYWSDYNGTDENQDGLGDTGYTICTNNTDSYPLIGMFSVFIAISGQHVTTISNSTVSDFQFNGTAIMFSVSGIEGTTGFCRVSIPKSLMNATYRVFVNGAEVASNLLPLSNSTCGYLYFSYNHSTQEVTIIPEFLSWLILPPFIVAATSVTTLTTYKRESNGLDPHD
jgi:parallel beta-helix repeat protein